MRESTLPLVRDLGPDPGPGRPFQTTPDRPHHPYQPSRALPELVVHVIDIHRVALNPAAITLDSLNLLHAQLHGRLVSR